MLGRALRSRKRHPFLSHPVLHVSTSSSSDEDEDYTPNFEPLHVTDTESISSADGVSEWVCFFQD